MKQMPKSRFYELYQDYVCGTALRLANEMLAMLPLAAVIVTAVDQLLNPATGHVEQQPILSLAVPRATMEALNLEGVDPSDAMVNFVHKMKFLKTKGFQPVDRVDASVLELRR